MLQLNYLWDILKWVEGSFYGGKTSQIFIGYPGSTFVSPVEDVLEDGLLGAISVLMSGQAKVWIM